MHYLTRFVVCGQVLSVRGIRGGCVFVLGDGEVRLPCVVRRATLDFWVTAGQTVEVIGYADRYCGRWQLHVVEARLVQSERGYRRRSARRIVDGFNRLLDGLLGPARE